MQSALILHHMVEIRKRFLARGSPQSAKGVVLELKGPTVS